MSAPLTAQRLRSFAWNIAAVAVLAATPALAQQTLFNNPSADVLAPGDLYLELDATSRPRLGFEGLDARAVFGAVDRLEIGVNVSPLFGNGIGGEVTVTPNGKVRLWTTRLGAAGELSVLTGTRIYVPVSFDGLALEGYGLAAWKSPFGLRLTAGGFGQLSHAARWVSLAGVTATAEYSIRDRLTLAAEWWQHRDLGAGIILPLPLGFTLYFAVLVSPSSAERNGLVVEIGRTQSTR